MSFHNPQIVNQALVLSGISRRFSMGREMVHALNNIRLSINEGEQIAVVGPSGCGKSSLMNIMGMLDNPDEGQYFFFGKEISLLSPNEKSLIRSQKIGFVFQQFHLLDSYTAHQNIELPMLYAKFSTQERRERVMELLDGVGLSKRSDHYPNQLSGGERQRVAIARALANSPRLLLADEPTGALDSKTGQVVLELILRLCLDSGITLIMVTHDLNLANMMTRQIQLQDGMIR